MGPVVKGSFASDVYNQSEKLVFDLSNMRFILRDGLTKNQKPDKSGP